MTVHLVKNFPSLTETEKIYYHIHRSPPLDGYSELTELSPSPRTHFYTNFLPLKYKYVYFLTCFVSKDMRNTKLGATQAAGHSTCNMQGQDKKRSLRELKL
jgi:hypothetical protein